MKKIWKLTAFLLLSYSLFAPGQIQALDAASGSVLVTVYPSGQALITEERILEIPTSGTVPFPGAPTTIDPTSVALHSVDQPGKLVVRSVRLLPSAADPNAVLRGYVGQEVKVILPDPADARARVTRKATLLSVGSRAVLDLGNEIYVGPLEAVLLPGGAERPRAEAALLLDVLNSGTKQHRVEASYLAGGLDWSGDCALSLNAAGDTGSLSCWATLKNDTGRAFNDARLRLVAGDVNRAAAPAPMYKGEARVMLEMNMGAGPSVQQVGEYHVFTVPFAADLAEGQTTRLALSSANAIRVDRELVVRGHALQHRAGGEPESRSVENVLVIENTKERGLGAPLPASLVRVYRDMTDGGRILEGEHRMQDLPEGETARLNLGSAFDVTARRTMLSYEKTGKNRVRVQWAVELRNSGTTMRDVVLLETFQGDWKITSASHDFAKVSADTARCVAKVPSGGKPVTVTYEAEMVL